jgi:O-Antigen ligase
MRASQDLRSPLLIVFALLAGALFLGGGSGDDALPWLGLAAIAALFVLIYAYGPPSGLVYLVPLGALAVWSVVTIDWSIEPDRSWAYANRAFVYLAFALVGACLAGKREQLAIGFAALLGAVCAWSLAGKVFPFLYEDYGRIARLRGPVGYWNALALLGDMALPLALWLATRWRTAGALLAFGWVVAIGLTYSRGGALVAVLVVVAWIALSRAWAAAIATLVAAGLPAAVVLGVAFSLSGVTSDGQSHATRVHDGLIFGAALLAGAGVAALLARLPPPEPVPAVRTAAIAVLAVALVGAIAFAAVNAHSWWDSFTAPAQTELSNSPGRFVSAGSNHRWSWWQEAWRGFEGHKAGGTGAGSFEFTNLRYRSSSIDDALEPHNVPLQFLSETGIVGFILLLATFAALIGPVRARPGPSAELALALVLPAYVLHGIFDIDWDFVAISAPVFLIAGSLVARPAERRRPAGFAVLAASGVALAVLFSLFSVWLAGRWTGQAEDALGSNPVHAVRLAQRSRSLNPLSAETLWAQALAEEELAVGRDRKKHLALAFGLFRRATRLQPQNEQAWFNLGEFNLRTRNCPQAAYVDFQHTYALNQYDLAALAEKDVDLKRVNSGTARC